MFLSQWAGIDTRSVLSRSHLDTCTYGVENTKRLPNPATKKCGQHLNLRTLEPSFSLAHTITQCITFRTSS